MWPFNRKHPQPQESPSPPTRPVNQSDDPQYRIVESLTGFALRHPGEAQLLYNAYSPDAATYDATIAALRRSLEQDPDIATRILEQINPTAMASSPTQEDWYWGRQVTGGEEDYYWRRLSDNWYQKDVIPSTFLEILNTCYEAYNANPLAMAIIEITVSFVIGKGLKVVAATKKLQKILDGFWNDPDNHMDDRAEDMCRELSMYGEIYVRFFVNHYDGAVKIRLIDPALIDQIDTDPEDIEKHLRYHMRPLGPSPTQTYDVVANTLDPGVFAHSQNSDSMGVGDGTIGSMVAGNKALSGQNPGDPTITGKWLEAGPDKEVIQIAINKVSNAKRGKSDLATLLPWLRRYKDWLTDRVRINKYKGAFLWDVQITNADKKTIQAKQSAYSYPPEPGSVIVHSETEQWKAVQPQINANEAKEDGRAIKLMVALVATIPEHFLSDGNNNTRATAAEMGLPTFLKFQRRQKLLKQALRKILDRVLREAIKAGKLAPGTDIAGAYDIQFPEFDQSSNQELGTALSYLTTGLATARQNGWISDETAMKAVFQFLNMEVNMHEEKEQIALDQAAHLEQAKKTAKAMATVKPASAAPAKSAQVKEAALNPQYTGMMLCFYPSPAVAKKLAVKGGEPARALHITLAYLGDTGDDPQDELFRPHTHPFKIRQAIELVTKRAAPLSGKIAGLGRFTSTPDGEKTPVFAAVDVPGLAELRSDLVEKVEAAGYFVAQDHGFTPHITLDYIDADAPMPDLEVPDVPLELDTLYLVVAGKRDAFPLALKGAKKNDG